MLLLKLLPLWLVLQVFGFRKMTYNTHLDGGSILFDNGQHSSRYAFNADEGGSRGSRYVEQPMHPPSINA